MHQASFRALHEQQLGPFRVYLVQGSQTGNNNLRLQFCVWFLLETVDEPDILRRVLWTDRETFKHEEKRSLRLPKLVEDEDYDDKRMYTSSPYCYNVCASYRMMFQLLCQYLGNI
jgi:hypothetical protein